MFNKKVADGLNITMSGMSHASEFIALAVENHWRVAEEPVEILYTDYSMSKGQPLLNGVNIIFDGLLRGRMSPMNWIQVLLIVSIVALLVYLLRSRRSARTKAWVKVGYVLFVIAGDLCDPAAGRHHRRRELARGGPRCGPDGLRADHRVRVHHAVSTYMRFKDLELKYARLARAVALQSARSARGALGAQTRLRGR